LIELGGPDLEARGDRIAVSLERYGYRLLHGERAVGCASRTTGQKAEQSDE
jgi:hypothetical protein